MGIKLRIRMAILTKKIIDPLLKTANGEAVGGSLDRGAVILQAEYTFSILDLVRHSHITLQLPIVKPFTTSLFWEQTLWHPSAVDWKKLRWSGNFAGKQDHHFYYHYDQKPLRAILERRHVEHKRKARSKVRFAFNISLDDILLSRWLSRLIQFFRRLYRLFLEYKY